MERLCETPVDPCVCSAVRVDPVEDSMWSKRPPEDGELAFVSKRCCFSGVLLIGFTCADVGEESGAADVEYTEVVHPQPAASAPGERLYIFLTVKAHLICKMTAIFIPTCCKHPPNFLLELIKLPGRGLITLNEHI